MSETIELGAASEHGAASPIAAITRVAPGPDHLNGEPIRARIPDRDLALRAASASAVVELFGCL